MAMRVSTSLPALAFLVVALAGCATPPEATPDALGTVEEQAGQAGPDLDPLNLPPTTLLQATPTSGKSPLKVVFSLSARDAEGDQMSWSLDPGDGSALQGGETLPVAVAHTYAPGRFQATFLVSDGKETASGRITIHATAAPSSQPPSPSGDGSAGGGGSNGAGSNDDGGSTSSTSTSGTTSSASQTTTSSSTSTSKDRGKDRHSSSTTTTTSSTTSTTSSSTGSTSETQTSTSGSSSSTSSETSTSTSETSTSSESSTSTSQTSTSSSSTSTTSPPAANAAPSASLDAQPDRPSAPANVTYTVAADDADGDLLAWTLDVQGDGALDANGGGTGGVWTVDVQFDEPGTYEAVLTVTDGQETTTDTVTVTLD